MRTTVFLLLITLTSLLPHQADQSPFERYRRIPVNESDLLKLAFELELMRASLQPPLPVGIGIPFVVGETGDGKLLVQVNVRVDRLPQDFAQRQNVLRKVAAIASRAIAQAVHTIDKDAAPGANLFDRWWMIQFADTEKAVREKSVDPFIGVFENGELTLFRSAEPTRRHRD